MAKENPVKPVSVTPTVSALTGQNASSCSELVRVRKPFMTRRGTRYRIVSMTRAQAEAEGRQPL